MNEPPVKKRNVARFIEGMGDAIILSIRIGRLARDPRRRKAVLRLLRKKTHHRITLGIKRLEPYGCALRSRILRPIAVRRRFLQRRLVIFHRRTPLPRLQLLYYSAFAVFFLAAFLLVWLGRARDKPVQRPVVAFESLMGETAKLIADKRLDEAEKNVVELKKLAPRNPTVHTFAGAIKSLRKDYAGARADYLLALEASPNNFNASYNLGELDFVTTNYAAAAVQFESLLKLRPQDEIILFRLFLCALLGNDDAKANAYLRLLFPAGVTPAWYYAHAARHFRDQQKSEARKLLNTAHLLYPDKTAFFDATMRLLNYK